MIQHYQRRLPESIGLIVQTKWEYEHQPELFPWFFKT